MPGPVPKRSQERRRRNKVAGSTTAPTASTPAKPPPCPQDWHPVARRWYLSLRTSGQAQFYEPSDWATAFYVGHQMSRDLNSSRMSAQAFAAVMAAMTELLTTEGARRRARLELERGEVAAPLAPVAVMDNYRDALG